MLSPSEQIVDARGKTFVPIERPARIVSLVPSITELLFALGLGSDEVVGRTKFCVHPAPQVEDIPDMGGTKTVHADRIREADPDLVIANVDENPRDVVEALDAWKPQPWVYVTHPLSVDNALVMIHDMGKLLGAGEKADALLADITAARDVLKGREPQRALYLIWRRPYMTIGPTTFIHSMLAEAGYEHVITDAWLDEKERSGSSRRYPELTPRDIAELRPSHILLSSEPFRFRSEHIAELRASLHVQDAEYAEQLSIRVVDGELYSWYGSRMLTAFRSFATEA
ncbi:ABC transporter substrate-binding protein [bacterium]|nr:ABC transporter substrate-binding protein [bacterium]